MCPVLWNNDKHNEFKLDIERPPQMPRIEITMPLDTLEKLHVKAGKMKWLEFDLEKGDAFKFHVSGDSSFGFTIVHVENEEDENNDMFSMRTVFPLFLWIHGPQKVPLEDTVVAPESGLYKVWFSNSRAWFYSVTIRHQFQVIKNQITE